MQSANRPASHRRSIKPERFLALGFFILIVAGGFVLTLPVSSADGHTVGMRQAMFTATSAVCVTGLSIVDVGVELSFFGQVILLALIQVGGLGFMAFATLIMVALGRRISLRDRMILRDAMNQDALSGMVRLTLAFFLIALVVELTGAALLMTRLIPLYGPARGVWQSLFTSVSAFCNAGFDLFGGYRSLTHLQHEPVILLTLGGLIMVGGLGFPVILECLNARFRWRKLPLHAKLVLAVTAGLIAFGMLSILALEWDNPRTLGGGLTVWQKLYNSLFPVRHLPHGGLRLAGSGLFDRSQQARRLGADVRGHLLRLHGRRREDHHGRFAGAAGDAGRARPRAHHGLQARNLRRYGAPGRDHRADRVFGHFRRHLRHLRDRARPGARLSGPAV